MQVVVDKTGTLTQGRPAVTEIVPNDSISAEELLCLAAAVESRSEHPLAAAILAARNSGVPPDPSRGLPARSQNLPAGRRQDASGGTPELRNFQSVTGGGVSGLVGGRSVLVGKPRFLRGQGVSGVEALDGYRMGVYVAG